MRSITIYLLIFAAFIADRAMADNLEGQILGLVSGAPNHELNRPGAAAELADEFREIGGAWDIEPSTLAWLAFWESSFHTDAIGPRGELGLLQVHPSTAHIFGCNFATRYAGIECGARVLAEALERCGTLRAALTSHATRGQCSTRNKRVIRKINWRMERIER